MRISDLFNSGKTVFSFEVFPPKRNSSIDTVYSTLSELKGLNPDFISVTYGAGGNTADSSTCDIASIIKNKYNIEPLAHITCVNSSKDNIDTVLNRFTENNIENVLALRGDINPEITPKEDFKYASDLVTYIKNKGNFDISGACYPEIHLEAKDIIEDITNLKYKVDCGASHLISQLFFDNNCFYSFLEKARIAGIKVPIEAGIMPVVNINSIKRMVSLCGASMPAKFTKIMQRYENNPEALRDAGIAYAVDQIVDLVSNGVDGIHLYTMNNPYVAKKIAENVGSIIRA